MVLDIKVEEKEDFIYFVNLRGSLDSHTYMNLKNDLNNIMENDL